ELEPGREKGTWGLEAEARSPGRSQGHRGGPVFSLTTAERGRRIGGRMLLTQWFGGEISAMARMKGTISITGLPPHRGLIVNLCFFAVAGPDVPAPYNGDPPAKAATDCDKVFEQVDLDKESQETAFQHDFDIERSPGYYYVQLRVILFQNRDGKVFAQ